MKKVDDVIGVLEYIKDVEEKPISWKDKKTGEAKKAVLFVIGLKLNEKWYNIEANSKVKAEEILKKLDGEKFKAGDFVKLYLEDKKGEGFWKVISVVEQEPIPLSETTQKDSPKKEEKPSVLPKSSVEDYKNKVADSMQFFNAMNNAAVLLNLFIDKTDTKEQKLEKYWSLVAEIYERGRTERKAKLGE